MVVVVRVVVLVVVVVVVLGFVVVVAVVVAVCVVLLRCLLLWLLLLYRFFFVCVRFCRIAESLCRRRCFVLRVGVVVLVRLVCVLVVSRCGGARCLC